MNSFKRGSVICGIGVLSGVYALIKLAPTRDKVTFLSRQSNKPTLDMRLLADEIVREHPETQVVLLPKRLASHLDYGVHMFRQMYHVATSKVVVLDSYCMVVSILRHKPGLQVIQMWHAIGSMKKFGYAMLDQPEGRSSELAELMHMHRGYTDVLISSKSFIKDLVEGFGVSPDIIHEIPLPRVDRLLDERFNAKLRERYIKRYPQLGKRKNILYCPTFRTRGPEDRHAVALRREKIEELFSSIDYERYNLIYKPHPLEKEPVEDERVLRVSGTTQDLLSIADYTISDYSSVIYEAGLRDIPVLLYAYDWDDYKERWQLNIDLEQDTPLPFSDNAHDLIARIEADDFDHAALKEFVDENVKVPHNATCCEKIVGLMRL